MSKIQVHQLTLWKVIRKAARDVVSLYFYPLTLLFCSLSRALRLTTEYLSRLFRFLNWLWTAIILAVALGVGINLLVGIALLVGSLRPEVSEFLQAYWQELVILGLILVILTVLAALIRQRQSLLPTSVEQESSDLARRPRELSREELDEFTRDAVDPTPLGAIRRPFHNTGLSDHALRQTIIERNRKRKPTYQLRMEYERRLAQRSRR